jgi:group II intron reverse transcriptase/maturase
MRNAETILGIIHDRGRRGLPLERVYRLLFNPHLYLLAYGRIARNDGALTPGATPETVDGMCLAKIAAIITALRQERYRWTPVRRVYIAKKGTATKKRPLGLPTWSDKLLQEVIRLILDAYYDVQFSPLSHGFRPGRGCHTGLAELYHTWHGTGWLIEGDIERCFDSLDQTVLVHILAEKIHDGRFLRLIAQLLKAGYLEDWRYHATLSGAPQGSIVSPILSNVYLDKLDKHIEQTLIPAYTRGTERRRYAPWKRIYSLADYHRRAGHRAVAAALFKRAQQLPTRDPYDPEYRRLRYVRYADDFLLGFNGPRAEAEDIKRQIGEFLRETLKLTLSEEKTLITNARSGAARFLGYEVCTVQANSKHSAAGQRSVNGAIGLRVPAEVVSAKCRPYQRNGKAIHRAQCLKDSVFSIVSQYQQEYRGVVEYYRMAYNLHTLHHLKWVMETSLGKTLAHKLRISVSQVHARYHADIPVGTKTYKGLQVIVERGDGKKPLVAQWGGIPLTWQIDNVVLNDDPPRIWNGRTELERRLLANTCELCGSKDKIEVHHIRALKDLHRRGRAEKPAWVRAMAARHRKALVVCHTCHQDIQHGCPRRQGTVN